MRDPLPFLPSRAAVRARYRVALLEDAVAAEAGVLYRHEGEDRVLSWPRVQRVIAAEVGEPQGVRTVVFDLLVGSGDLGFELLRFDAEPGEDAVDAADQMIRNLPVDRLCASIKAIATDGLPLEWHPDLPSFEEAALAALVEARL